MYYPVCRVVYTKESLLLIGKRGGSGFRFSWSFTTCPTPYNRKLNVLSASLNRERKGIFYLTTHSTHFIYGYMASDTWLRTILIVRKETRCRHMGYSFRLTASVLLYAPSNRQDSTYHCLCYTIRRALAGTRNSSMGSPLRIDPTTHPTMSERSYHGATTRSRVVK